MTTTYTYNASAVSDAQIGHKKGVTLQQGRALRDNPKGMAQGADDAPVIFTGWHPYNLTEVGGSETGLIYDFATDGAAANKVSPDFEDGFEYAFVFDGLSSDSGPPTELQISLYGETSASYLTDTSVIDSLTTEAEKVFGVLSVDMPRLSKYAHSCRWISGGHAFSTATSAVTASTQSGAVLQSNTKQTVLRARLKFDAGSFDAGSIYMLRRREYLTG
jgi:hypothetical protein